MPAFGSYRIDLEEERLWSGERLLTLRRKPFAILKFLVANPRRLVTHQELIDQIWGGAAISESAVRTHLHELRQVLGEGVIETVVGRGYRFTAALHDAAGPVSPPASLDGLVGRDGELALLRGALSRAHDGHRQVCFVIGEPGIGKTALIDRFLDELGDPIAMRGHCVEQLGSPEPYLAVIEMLGKLRTHEQAIAALIRYAPTFLAQVPQLVPEAQLAEVTRRAAGGTESRMVRELIEAIEVIAAQHTVVIVLEDLQWSDVATIDLLAMLCQRRERARLLVVATSRRAEAQTVSHPLNRVMRTLVARSGATSIALERIARDDIRRLLDLRFPTHAFPVELVEVVDRITHGTPLFVTTLLEDLAARGMAVQRDGRWQLAVGIAEVARHRPDSIKQLIDIQLDRLVPQEQRVLEAASVVGLEFPISLIAAALDSTEESVDELLDGLARRGLFIRRAESEEWPDGSLQTRYATTHGLVHEVCVERGVPARRQRWHRLIAERLERAYTGKLEDIAHVLGPHLEAGQLPQRAIEMYLLAGARMTRRFASSDTITLFERTLALTLRLPASPDRDRVELRVLQGLTSVLLRGYLNTDGNPVIRFERMIELARRLGDREALVHALVNSSIFYSTLSDYRRGAELAEDAAALVSDATSQIRELLDTARVVPMIWQGDIRGARDCLRLLISGSELAPPSFDIALPDRNIVNLAYMTLLDLLTGAFTDALARADQTRRLAVANGDPWALGLAGINLARARMMVGGAAAEARAAAVEVLEMPFAARWHGPAMLVIAWADSQTGALDDARLDAILGELREALARQPIGPSHFVLPLLYTLATMGRTQQALALIAEILTACLARNERIFVPELLRLRGELTEATDRASALTDYRDALRFAREISASLLELRAATRLAIAVDPAERESALADVRCALAAFTDGFEARDVIAAKRLLA